MFPQNDKVISQEYLEISAKNNSEVIFVFFKLVKETH